MQHSPRFSGWDTRLHNWASPSESWLRFQTCLCGISQIPTGKERLVVSSVTYRAPLAEAREFGRARAEHALAKGNPTITACQTLHSYHSWVHTMSHILTYFKHNSHKPGSLSRSCFASSSVFAFGRGEAWTSDGFVMRIHGCAAADPAFGPPFMFLCRLTELDSELVCM